MVPESESWSRFREENKETSFSQFLKSLCFLRRTVGFSWSLCSFKTLILIRFRDSDSTKKPWSGSGFSGIILYLTLGWVSTVPPVIRVCLRFRTCTCCKISRGLNIRYNKPNVHRRLRWRAHSLYYYFIQVLKTMVEKICRFKFNRNQCCRSGMFITDPNFFHPLSRIRIKEFNYFNPKNGF